MDNKLNDPEELFDIPAKYCCSYVGARMDRSLIGNVDNYQQYEEVPHEPFIGSGKFDHIQISQITEYYIQIPNGEQQNEFRSIRADR